MMRFGDWAIRKRLLFSNFIMFFIPAVVFILASISIFLLLQFGNINRTAIISFIWPESGPSLAIQFEISRIYVGADTYNGSMNELRKVSDHLEDQGLQVAICRGGEMLYETQGTDGRDIIAQVRQKIPAGNATLLWSQQGVSYYYVSHRSGLQVAVTGKAPIYPDDGYIDLSTKQILKIAFVALIGFILVLTIFIGLYLSRWMAGQIIEPLKSLRNMAENVSQGNLDQPVSTDMRDEVGDTCRAFEKMRQQLKAGREMQEKYERSRQELIVGISHDLATPLTKIEGYACGLIDGIANTPKKQNQYLHMILETAEMMSRLVQTLFLFSKFNLGKIEFHWELADVCSYLSNYVDEQKEYFRKRGLDISYTATVTKAVVRMDRIQFQRVVENIIENSIKYKEADVGRLQISVAPGRDGAVRLAWADDGCGVSPEELPHLFDSFYRTDKARTDVAKGSGLGLAVVKQIVEEMKGKIWAEQTEPKGLTICIELPLQEGGE